MKVKSETALAQLDSDMASVAKKMSENAQIVAGKIEDDIANQALVTKAISAQVKSIIENFDTTDEVFSPHDQKRLRSAMKRSETLTLLKKAEDLRIKKEKAQAEKDRENAIFAAELAVIDARDAQLTFTPGEVTVRDEPSSWEKLCEKVKDVFVSEAGGPVDENKVEFVARESDISDPSVTIEVLPEPGIIDRIENYFVERYTQKVTEKVKDQNPNLDACLALGAKANAFLEFALTSKPFQVGVGSALGCAAATTLVYLKTEDPTEAAFVGFLSAAIVPFIAYMASTLVDLSNEPGYEEHPINPGNGVVSYELDNKTRLALLAALSGTAGVTLSAALAYRIYSIVSKTHEAGKDKGVLSVMCDVIMSTGAIVGLLGVMVDTDILIKSMRTVQSVTKALSEVAKIPAILDTFSEYVEEYDFSDGEAKEKLEHDKRVEEGLKFVSDIDVAIKGVHRNDYKTWQFDVPFVEISKQNLPMLDRKLCDSWVRSYVEGNWEIGANLTGSDAHFGAVLVTKVDPVMVPISKFTKITDQICEKANELYDEITPGRIAWFASFVAGITTIAGGAWLADQLINGVTSPTVAGAVLAVESCVAALPINNCEKAPTNETHNFPTDLEGGVVSKPLEEPLGVPLSVADIPSDEPIAPGEFDEGFPILEGRHKKVGETVGDRIKKATEQRAQNIDAKDARQLELDIRNAHNEDAREDAFQNREDSRFERLDNKSKARVRELQKLKHEIVDWLGDNHRGNTVHGTFDPAKLKGMKHAAWDKLNEIDKEFALLYGMIEAGQKVKIPEAVMKFMYEYDATMYFDGQIELIPKGKEPITNKQVGFTGVPLGGGEKKKKSLPPTPTKSILKRPAELPVGKIIHVATLQEAQTPQKAADGLKKDISPQSGKNCLCKSCQKAFIFRRAGLENRRNYCRECRDSYKPVEVVKETEKVVNKCNKCSEPSGKYKTCSSCYNKPKDKGTPEKGKKADRPVVNRVQFTAEEKREYALKTFSPEQRKAHALANPQRYGKHEARSAYSCSNATAKEHSALVTLYHPQSSSPEERFGCMLKIKHNDVIYYMINEHQLKRDVSVINAAGNKQHIYTKENEKLWKSFRENGSDTLWAIKASDFMQIANASPVSIGRATQQGIYNYYGRDPTTGDNVICPTEGTLDGNWVKHSASTATNHCGGFLWDAKRKVAVGLHCRSDGPNSAGGNNAAVHFF
jgi:hypothetical protein